MRVRHIRRRCRSGGPEPSFDGGIEARLDAKVWSKVLSEAMERRRYGGQRGMPNPVKHVQRVAQVIRPYGKN
jgi:hypothetical protein